MKTLLVALNSKYIHSSLPLWYLKACCDESCGETLIMEYSINDTEFNILSGIYRQKADIIAFSCYIWNIEYIKKIVKKLKTVCPNMIIIFGGPEVLCERDEDKSIKSLADYIIRGEGEEAFPLLLRDLNNKNIKDIQYNDLIYKIDNLDAIPSPYNSDMLKGTKDKIVYYESSRGCPFSCSYCLSSRSCGIRCFSMDRVLQDLKVLISSGIHQVKFIDRTFNYNKKRAFEILSFIKDCAEKEPSIYSMNFHFEVCADLFDQDTLRLLEDFPPGFIQLETGIQSLNEVSLKAVDRHMDLEKELENIAKILNKNNIHVHVDLIAGLPYEDMESFRKSFNGVYALLPHYIQLGFLKLLKGTKIRDQAWIHEYCYSEEPPYEILSNRYISFDEIITLKGIESLIDKYYNSGRFGNTLKYLTGNICKDPFELFRRFLEYCNENGLEIQQYALKEYYNIINSFSVFIAPDEKDIVRELLKMDYLLCQRPGNYPESLDISYNRAYRDRCINFLSQKDNIEKHFPYCSNKPVKEIIKNLYFCHFSIDVYLFKEKGVIIQNETDLLFDYRDKNPVTAHYKCFEIDLG